MVGEALRGCPRGKTIGVRDPWGRAAHEWMSGNLAAELGCSEGLALKAVGGGSGWFLLLLWFSGGKTNHIAIETSSSIFRGVSQLI